MSNNLIKQWREERRKMRRCPVSSWEYEQARERLAKIEREMTPKQLAQVRDETTEGCS